MGRQKFSGQPENQINALGVHCANCVDLSYLDARIRAMMACSSICFIPSSLRSSGLSDEARVSVDLREGGRRPCPLEFIFFKEHMSFEFGGVPMPLTGTRTCRVRLVGTGETQTIIGATGESRWPCAADST